MTEKDQVERPSGASERKAPVRQTSAEMALLTAYGRVWQLNKRPDSKVLLFLLLPAHVEAY